MRIKRAISNLGSLATHQTLDTFDEIFVIHSLGLIHRRSPLKFWANDIAFKSWPK